MKVIQGTFQFPDGSAVATGVLHLKLSGDAVVSGTAQIAPKDITVTLDSSGNIPSNTQIYANDELTPSGTVYYVALLDANGAQVFGAEQWSITGASPISLNTMTPTNNGVTYPSPLTSVGLSMPGEFTVAGSPLTSNGTIAVTKANESANQVFAGPTSGGAAAPTFRALVDADIPTTLANHTLTSPTVTNPTTTGTDSGTETLKNKTLNGASSGNNVSLLNFQGVGAQTTGNGALQTLYTYSLPANTLAVGKGIRITAVLLHSAGTASVSYQINFGATAVLTNSSTNGVGVNVYRATVMATGAATQVSFNEQSANATPVSGETSPTETISGNITITVQFNVANTDKVTPQMFMVELIQ